MPGVRRLDQSDAAAVQRLLDADPVQNVYLRSELRLGSLRSGMWWASPADGGDALDGVVVGGALIVPWLPRPAAVGPLAGHLDSQPPPRMIVGPRAHVLALNQARSPSPVPREAREPQPLMSVRRGGLRVAPSPHVRRGARGDLDRLVVAAAAMHREEMGVDPLAVDPTGWRVRMTTLVDRGWSFVWTEGREIVFKAELSGWTPEVCQVQGVYTAPGHRGAGVGTAGMAAVCAMVLEDVPECSLYVNDFNEPALRLYRRLGFEQVGEFATLLF